jgi:hypothetical protein
MKKYSKTLALVLAAGACVSARANLFSDNFDTTIVAERTKDAPPAQDSPVACTLVDGGYIEAGDPIAGENPPSAASVRQELLDALGQQGFHVGAPAPAVLLTYYWGVLRVDHTEIRLPMGINANQDARIKLVSTEETGAEVENHILSRKNGGGENLDASSPVILVGPLETIVENARQPRFFIVVSAYQYQAPGETQRPKLLWRAKLSAQETSGSMDEVIPALIAKGASYFGKDMLYPKLVENTLMKSVAVAPSTQNSNGQTGMASDEAPSPAVGALVKQERTAIAGTGDGKS